MTNMTTGAISDLCPDQQYQFQAQHLLCPSIPDSLSTREISPPLPEAKSDMCLFSLAQHESGHSFPPADAPRRCSFMCGPPTSPCIFPCRLDL